MPNNTCRTPPAEYLPNAPAEHLANKPSTTSRTRPAEYHQPNTTCPTPPLFLFGQWTIVFVDNSFLFIAFGQ
jgi:hypothetical protein